MQIMQTQASAAFAMFGPAAKAPRTPSTNQANDSANKAGASPPGKAPSNEPNRPEERLLGKEPNARPEKLDSLENSTERKKVDPSLDAQGRAVDAEVASRFLVSCPVGDACTEAKPNGEQKLPPLDGRTVGPSPNAASSAARADVAGNVQPSPAGKTQFPGYAPDVPLMGYEPDVPLMGVVPPPPPNSLLENLGILSMIADRDDGGAADVAPPIKPGAAEGVPAGDKPVPASSLVDERVSLVTPGAALEPNTDVKAPIKTEGTIEPKPAVEVKTPAAETGGMDSDADTPGSPGKGFGSALGAPADIDTAPQSDADPKMAAISGSNARSDAAPAAAVDRAPSISAADRASVVRQIADRVQLLAASRPRDGVTIHLDPKELGSLTLVVKSQGNEIETRIYAHSDVLRSALEHSRPQLTQALESRGLSLGAMTIGQHEAQQQHTGQQMARNATPTRFESAFGTDSGLASAVGDWRSAARSSAGVDLWI